MTQSLHIVIVEDHALIAMDMADLLIGIGHHVCAIARTEQEAVGAAARFHPNLMIVDDQLEEGCGINAMRQILTRGFVPHLYVTGDQSRLQGLMQNAVVIAKPFNLRDLVDGIARVRPL